MSIRFGQGLSSESPRCRMSRRLNPGRRSTYQIGKTVQTNRGTSVETLHSRKSLLALDVVRLGAGLGGFDGETNFNQAGKPAALQQHAARKMRSYQIAETLMKGYF